MNKVAEVLAIVPVAAYVTINYRESQLLSKKDILGLKRSTKLTTSHINGAIALLRIQHPVIDGLFNVQHGEKGNYPMPKSKPWMQKISNGACHWFLAVAGFNVCGDQDVAVYDSMGFCDEVIMSMKCSLMGGQNFTLRTPSCQKQCDRSSCGVFAIAFATSLAAGQDPSALVCETEAKMRDHLKHCLLKSEISQYPTTSTTRRQDTRLKVKHVIN